MAVRIGTTTIQILLLCLVSWFNHQTFLFFSSILLNLQLIISFSIAQVTNIINGIIIKIVTGKSHILTMNSVIPYIVASPFYFILLSMIPWYNSILKINCDVMEESFKNKKQLETLPCLFPCGQN